jgi:hypothetical protein
LNASIENSLHHRYDEENGNTDADEHDEPEGKGEESFKHEMTLSLKSR